MEKKIPESEIATRVQKLQMELGQLDLDGALIIQKTDLYYFAGTDQECHLWIPAQGEPVLMVRRSLVRAREVSPIKEIVPLVSSSQFPRLLRSYYGEIPATIGMELDVVPAKLFLQYQRILAPANIVDISKSIRTIRMVKSEYEIEQIRACAKMADEMFAYVAKILAEVGTENELAYRLEAFCRSMGHVGISRTRGFNMECHYGHILAGPGGARPSSAPGPTGGTGLGPFYSQGAGLNRIKPCEPVVVDYTASVMGYLSDQARVFCLDKLPNQLVEAHRAMMEITDMVAKHAKPGTVAGEIYDMALEMARRSGYEKGFMGYPDPVPFIAHGVGLELDEWPILGRNSNVVLKEGMVLALEPKVVFPDKGVVGIENTMVVRKNGLEKLNKFPEEIYEIKI